MFSLESVMMTATHGIRLVASSSEGYLIYTYTTGKFNRVPLCIGKEVDNRGAKYTFVIADSCSNGVVGVEGRLSSN